VVYKAEHSQIVRISRTLRFLQSLRERQQFIDYHVVLDVDRYLKLEQFDMSRRHSLLAATAIGSRIKQLAINAHRYASFPGT
jgi:hypothetical protein